MIHYLSFVVSISRWNMDSPSLASWAHGPRRNSRRHTVKEIYDSHPEAPLK